MDVTAEIKRYGAQELAAAAGVALATVTRARDASRLLATAAGERMRKALVNGSASPDQLSVYEELRLEELRIKRLKADALERDAAVAAGELIPAADVHARLGAGALAIRQGMEATRRAVLAAATKGCRKAVAAALDAGNRNLLEGMKSAMGKRGLNNVA